MRDSRIDKWAEILINYSLKVEAGQRVLIQGDLLALPLLEACYEKAVDAGARVECLLNHDRLHEYLLNHAAKEQILSTSMLKQYAVETFEAITGMQPQSYKGDTPRAEVGGGIYHSTSVAPGHTIPPHQEVSSGSRKDMPRFISFFCATPPANGTGQTQVSSAQRVSEEVEKLMPNLWLRMRTKKLTYTARYLPDNAWYTNWIRWLNPSHGTIRQRFGTDDRDEIEAQCAKEGLTCEWDGAWAIISRKGVPATINHDGKELFCNQIHLDKLNPTLCGGWINYIFARILLYPFSNWTQFDVEFDDGTQISMEEADRLLQIVHSDREGRDWKKGDIMVLNNLTTMHAKTVHTGERKVLVAMAGSALPSRLAI